ncbi:MAG TPA: tyrosine-protein phosphatase [Aggregatilineales bacterium]|nr:tyrosine-protein phosphatase [Aggregatilineales bacterium]
MIDAKTLLKLMLPRRGRRKYPTAESLIIQPQVDVIVARQPNDDLLITWTLNAEAVEIYGGPQPDHIDRTAPLARVVGERSASISGLDPAQRTYFELAFHRGSTVTRRKTAERALPLQGGANFRDLGGYHTADGRSVRWGCIFRSGGLSRLTEQDGVYLSRMGLRVVCDLRTEREINEEPDQIPEGAQYLKIPILSDEESAESARYMLGNLKRLDAMVEESYTDLMVDQKAAVFGDVLRLCANPDNLPAMIHCTAGKDRTGVAIVLLLMALGVPDETIIADYSLTNMYYTHLRDAQRSNLRKLAVFRVTLNDFLPALTANPTLIRATIHHIQAHYGTIEAYLTGPAGLEPDALNRLRDNLLEPLDDQP